MGSTSEQVREPLPVYFSPSLYDQRRLWVMSILRRERVSEVLDLGCGDGNLLACLCNPPPWLPGGPATQFSSAHGIPAIRDEPLSFVHAKRLIGLDISSRELAIAVQTTAPEEPSDSPNPWSQEKRRWENLEVTILEGSFVDYNPDMCDIECIVSTEVIEHLPADVLPYFAPMLLGVYAPRLLLLTTPSYDYNARFHDPSTPEHLRAGFPDPTGRTRRVFRHSDHKFEWTRAEFSTWCSEAAREWGYNLVECDSRGRCSEEDPRDPLLGGASQVALFRRREQGDYTEKRRLAREHHSSSISERQHALLAKHVYDVDVHARRSASLQNIHQCMHDAFVNDYTRVKTVFQLWLSGEVSRACGGWLSVLLDAIDSSRDLSLIEIEGEPKDEWNVEYHGDLPDPPGPEDHLSTHEEIESDDDEYDIEDTNPPTDITSSSAPEEWQRATASSWGSERLEWDLASSTSSSLDGWVANNESPRRNLE